jgi:hypothetical protein
MSKRLGQLPTSRPGSVKLKPRLFGSGRVRIAEGDGNTARGAARAMLEAFAGDGGPGLLSVSAARARSPHQLDLRQTQVNNLEPLKGLTALHIIR